jgi:hypothetical protein
VSYLICGFQGSKDGSGKIKNLLPAKFRINMIPLAIILEKAGEKPPARNAFVIRRSKRQTAPTMIM